MNEDKKVEDWCVDELKSKETHPHYEGNIFHIHEDGKCYLVTPWERFEFHECVVREELTPESNT